MVKKISIVIPNYNGAKLLEKNLPGVVEAAAAYSVDTEIIIIDDASTDNSIDVIKNKFPEIKIYKKEKNEGFSSTVNMGVNKAKGEIVILLNSDVFPDKNLLSVVSSGFVNTQMFAVAFLDLSMENGREVERGRGIGRYKRGFLLHAKGNCNKNNTLWASGGSSAFDRKKWMELGGMDEIYNPFYWEDIDLSYRALKNGWNILFDKNAVVHHNHEEGSIKSIYSASDIKTIAYRNQFLFVWKNITQIKFITMHFLWLPYHLIKAFFRSDYSFFKGYFQAMMIMLTKLPRKTRGLVSDEMILNQFTD